MMEVSFDASIISFAPPQEFIQRDFISQRKKVPATDKIPSYKVGPAVKLFFQPRRVYRNPLLKIVYGGKIKS